MRKRWFGLAAVGALIAADLGGTSYGKYVRIDHGGGYATYYYAHLDGFNVSVGQGVGYGKVLGWVGSTGGSTGPHLHYEQRPTTTARRAPAPARSTPAAPR
ncbi:MULTISPECIES: M23 family metallopeptidase [unclassified Micromonospora]|uniref:M23 family metallopeptidase n=1 Tax=unclassified Micromonospora TaxID=2617518 RepID=UPI003632928B